MSRRTNRFRNNETAVSEEQVIEYLNVYFTLFETNLKDNNISDMNTKLPLLVVDKFRKLFQLWDENRILEKSINKEIFKTVHSQMSDSFDHESTDEVDQHTNSMPVTDYVLLECRQCGEEIVMRNNNLRYSYDFHKRTIEHLELLEYLNGDSENLNQRLSSKMASTSFHTEPNFSMRDKENDDINKNSQSSVPTGITSCPIVIKRKIRVDECCKQFNNSASTDYDSSSKSDASEEHLITPLPQQVSILPKSQPNFIDQLDKKCISVVNQEARCKFCFVKFASFPNFISHVTGRYHAKKMQLYRLNSTYGRKIDENIVTCMLCITPHFRIDEFLVHCAQPKHRANAVTSRNEPGDVMVFATTAFQCPVCELSVVGVESLFQHLKKLHKIR